MIKKTSFTSLTDLAKNRLVSEIIEPVASSVKFNYKADQDKTKDLESGMKSSSDIPTSKRAAAVGLVLVLDSHTLRVVSSICRRQELTDAGVLFIEQIEKPRQPFPDLDVVYFTTLSAIDQILQDHVAPLYRYSHVFFSSGKASDSMLEKLSVNREFVSRCKNLTEMNLDFACFEPRVFYSDTPYAIHYLGVNSNTPDSILNSHTGTLSSLFASLKERPVIRYMSPEASVSKSNLSQRIGLGLRRELDELVKTTNGGTTLLILDRSIETSALFLHDLYYQALASDILDGEDGVEWPLAGSTSVVPTFEYEAQTGKGKENRRVLLSDHDPLWVRFRHDHFRIAADGITRELSDLAKLNSLSSSSQTTPVENPLELLRSIPEYQDQLLRLSVHLELSKRLINVFEQINLMEVVKIEQELATGVDDDGKEIHPLKVFQAIQSLCNDARLGVDEKLRLVLLFLTQVCDVGDSISADLIKKHAKLIGVFESAVHKFLQLGIHSSASPASRSQPDGVMTTTSALGITSRQSQMQLKPLSLFSDKQSKVKKNKTIARSSKFVHCRFRSELTDVVESIFLNQLDNSKFPTVAGTGTSQFFISAASQPDQTASSTAAMWGSSAASGGRTDHRHQRLVVFVVGGITLGECREMAELESKFGIEILLGGSCVLTPNRLIEILLSSAHSSINQVIT